MKGQGGGGTARGGGKTRSGGGSIKLQKSKQRKTKDIDEKIVVLRQALFAANGKDKDVTQGIAPAFLKYDRNGAELEIEFSPKLLPDQAEWAFELVRETMEPVYDASGYGWDDDDKFSELTEPGARFLLVRKKRLNFDDRPGDLIGFVHFRFTIQGEFMNEMVGETSLQIWDIHLQEAYRRKGVGRHLLTLLELIARREKMAMISVPVQLGHDNARNWVELGAKGFMPDESLKSLVGFDSEMEVYAKILAPPKPRAPEVAVGSCVPSSSSAPTESTPVKKSGVALSTDVASPCSISFVDETASEEPLKPSNFSISVEEPLQDIEEVSEGDIDLDLSEAQEADVLLQLEELYREKHGRDPTDEEKQQWKTSLRETIAEAVANKEVDEEETNDDEDGDEDGDAEADNEDEE